MRFAIVLLFCLAYCGCGGPRDDLAVSSQKASDFFASPVSLALAEAAARGNIAEMTQLLKDGGEVDSPGRFGVTAAWWAVRTKSKNGFSFLLSRGANPNPDVDTITILEMAAGYEDSGFLETALSYRPAINRVGRSTGDAPIDTAITQNRTRNLELLIKARADLDIQAGSGGLPILQAIYAGRYDYVHMLLLAGANPDKVIAGGKVSLVNQISRRYVDPDSDAFVWRERVIRFLRSKGIEAHPPANEGKRTKPLPADLR